MRLNKHLITFAKLEKEASKLFANRAKNGCWFSKAEINEELAKKYKSAPSILILLAVESAAEANNFHGESGPWLRDLTNFVGHFSSSDLTEARKKNKS